MIIVNMRIFLAAIVVALLWGAMTMYSKARDNGQWEATDGNVRAWYRDLMQPDNPRVSCCGEADAYHADSFEADGDNYIAIITDTRPDGPLGRPHIDAGTRVSVPTAKLKFDRGNPTGHGVIFIGVGRQVLCFVAPGGV